MRAKENTSHHANALTTQESLWWTRLLEPRALTNSSLWSYHIASFKIKMKIYCFLQFPILFFSLLSSWFLSLPPPSLETDRSLSQHKGASLSCSSSPYVRTKSLCDHQHLRDPRLWKGRNLKDSCTIFYSVIFITATSIWWHLYWSPYLKQQPRPHPLLSSPPPSDTLLYPIILPAEMLLLIMHSQPPTKEAQTGKALVYFFLLCCPLPTPDLLRWVPAM